jgi:hypothetical protein
MTNRREMLISSLKTRGGSEKGIIMRNRKECMEKNRERNDA